MGATLMLDKGGKGMTGKQPILSEEDIKRAYQQEFSIIISAGDIQLEMEYIARMVTSGDFKYLGFKECLIIDEIVFRINEHIRGEGINFLRSRGGLFYVRERVEGNTISKEELELNYSHISPMLDISIDQYKTFLKEGLRYDSFLEQEEDNHTFNILYGVGDTFEDLDRKYSHMRQREIYYNKNLEDRTLNDFMHKAGSEYYKRVVLPHEDHKKIIGEHYGRIEKRLELTREREIEEAKLESMSFGKLRVKYNRWLKKKRTNKVIRTNRRNRDRRNRNRRNK